MIRFLQTPGPIKKVLLGGLLTIICVFMVITLVPGFGTTDFLGGGPQRGVVARVAGQDITTLEAQKQAREMVQQQFPKGGPEAAMLFSVFARQAVNRLILRKAVISEAERMGFRASEQEVQDELEKGAYAPTFFPGGKFIGQQAYQALIEQHDMTVPQFEDGVREDILINKLRNLVVGSVVVTDAETRQEFDRRNTQVKFDYAVISKDDVLKEIHPSDSELKAFYDSRKAIYNNAIPEKRKVEYAVLDSGKIQAETPVTEQDMQSYYDQHRSQFQVPDRVNVRHILIKTPLPGPDGKVDKAALEEARKKAEDILQQLRSGANFEDLAKKYSQDSGSAANGGSLGWVQKGQLMAEPDFEKAAFSLAKGATSDLVESTDGFHIIRVDDREAARFKSLDEVRSLVALEVKQEKAEQAVDNAAHGLLNQARTDGLDKAAAARGLQVVTTDFVSRTDSLPGIGSAAQFMQAAFAASEKAPPDEVQLPQGYAVFQVLAIRPPATPTFEEIRSRVENEFKNERAATLLSQKTQELADRAKAAHDLKKAAKELGAAIKTSDLVTIEGQVPDVGAMGGPASVVFGMKPGDISGPINNGNTGAVLSILERKDPSDQDFAAKKDEIRDSLRQGKQQELFQLFLSSLQSQMEKSGKIKINQDEMKTLTGPRNEEEGE
jgi:peptidyl-prolyl cis-trans isomerase D